MTVTQSLPLAALLAALSLQALAGEQVVTISGAYTNVFELNGDGSAGGYQFGTPYNDLTRAQIIDIGAGSAKLGPNTGFYEDVCISGIGDNPFDPYWCGADLATPNKFVDLAAFGAIDPTTQPQMTVSATLGAVPAGYTAKLYVRGFTADYGGNYAFEADVPAAGGAVTVDADFTGGLLVNYQIGVTLAGAIIDPADAASIGYMTVGDLKATFATPSAPTVTTTPLADGTVLISWTPGAVAPHSYVIQQSTGGSSRDSGWTDLATVSWLESSYTASGYATDETVTFRVLADGYGAADTASAGSSATIPAASAAPVPTTPVPALPFWALALLGGLVGLLGYRKVAK